MRAFIVLGFLLAAANAASLGYQYGPGIQTATVDSYGSGSGGLIGAGSNLVGATGGRVVSSGIGSVGLGGGLSGGSYSSRRVVSTGGLGSGSLIGSGNLGGGLISTTGYGSGNLIGSGSVGSGLIGGGNLGGRLVSSGNLGGNVLTSGSSTGYQGGTTVVGLNALDNVPQTVELSKQYFYFAAPEEPVNEGAITRQLSNVLKKNLQVVFIRAPENNAATSAALQLAKQAIEQRTAIYVLSKQQDANHLVGQLQQIQESVPTAPEVKFIKYRTEQDIAHAKNTIQSQYEQLGGSSQEINGGIAPVLNYASQSTGGVVGYGGGSSLLASGSGSYGGGAVLSSGSGSYGGGAVLSSGSGSLGGGAILGGGISRGSTLVSSGSGLGGGAILSGGGLSGGSVLSGGALDGLSSTKTIVSSPIVNEESSVEYLPPFKK